MILSEIKGFILNIPTEYKWGFVKLPFTRKHWYAVCQIGPHFYNLDSKLDAPQVIGEQEKLTVYLKEQIQCKDKELLIVVSSECAQQDKWYSQPQNIGPDSDHTDTYVVKEDKTGYNDIKQLECDQTNVKTVDQNNTMSEIG